MGLVPRRGASRAAPLLALCALVACVEPGGVGDDAGVPDGSRCLDDSSYEVCVDGSCASVACRGDELCQDAACVPWESAELSCDFSLSTSETNDRRVFVQVAPGGFPRAQVEALRFDFGDGGAGWGETLHHDYAGAGVYLVSLEVRLTGFRLCRARRLAALGAAESATPIALTVDEIPELLNGSLPVERAGGTERFELAVPRRGFTVDVARLAHPDDALTSVSLTSDSVPGELLERVRFAEDGLTGAWLVDEDLPLGPLTLTLAAETASGRRHERALTVRVVELPPERDPFDRPQVWLFRSGRDFFTTRRSADTSRYELISERAPNGVPDLLEELTLLGAQGPDPVANERYFAWIREDIRREVYRTYGVAPDGTALDGVPLSIFWSGEPDAPDPATFTPDGELSLMRFGGTFDGFVGFSGISPWNHERTDDSTANRGVATAGLLGILASTPVVSEALDPIDPFVGVPVGAHPRDAEALDPAFDRYRLDADPEVLARHETLRALSRYVALVIASVTAHEMGHAMGLMPNGLPPLGFFGDVRDVPFVNPARTNPWHADLPGLNLMQAGGDYLGVIDEALATLDLPRGADLVVLAEILALENRLSAYSRAYLQRRLTYESADGMASGLSVGCAHR